MERLMNNLNRGGIPVTPTIVSSFGELQQKIRSGEADLFIVGEIMDFPDPYALLYRLFYSSSAGNLFNYRNPRIDQLLIAAQKTTEEKTRASLYAEIEHCILEEAIVIPLFTTNYTLILSRKIKGIELTPLGFQYLPLRTIWIQE
jgi:peptide/nickel transport system substrate-binding protein